MPSVIDTKNRLSSAKSTQKVIKAMELVASSKIKKAREKAQNISFFYDTTIEILNSIFEHKDIKDFIIDENSDESLIFGINSDMGLCGAFNVNIQKEMTKLINENKNATVIAVGNKIVNKLEFEKVEVQHQFKRYTSINEEDLAHEITDIIVEKINNKKLKSFKIVYTKFVNALVQEVEVVDLFSFDEFEQKVNKTNQKVVEIEPDRDTVLKQLVKQYVYSVVYTVILQSLASEHSHRRNAMDSANKNSLELIDKLNLELNRIRQANITQEISEIIGGAEALKEG